MCTSLRVTVWHCMQSTITRLHTLSFHLTQINTNCGTRDFVNCMPCSPLLFRSVCLANVLGLRLWFILAHLRHGLFLTWFANKNYDPRITVSFTEFFFESFRHLVNTTYSYRFVRCIFRICHLFLFFSSCIRNVIARFSFFNFGIEFGDKR